MANMTKKEFIDILDEFLIPDDKPYNRQQWNDTLDLYSRNGLLNINRAQYWTKSPLRYYGESKIVKGKKVRIR